MDIIRHDWPEVKTGLSKGLYDRDEPLPVDVADLGTLALPLNPKVKWSQD